MTLFEKIRRIRKFALVGGSVFTRDELEASKAHIKPGVSLSALNQDVVLSYCYSVCLRAAMLNPVIMIID